MIKKLIIPKRISFQNDLIRNKENISKKIFNKNILVIGGAGTIGSNYIKQILINVACFVDLFKIAIHAQLI